MDWNAEQGKGERAQRDWASEKCDCSKALAADRARILLAIRELHRDRYAEQGGTCLYLSDLLRVVEGG